MKISVSSHAYTSACLQVADLPASTQAALLSLMDLEICSALIFFGQACRHC